MSEPEKPSLTPRKQPRQARSEQLVKDILAAAAQVLGTQGAARFTTARVAERAGVSVGSLYQYFPSKEAILFRLQTDEWAQTSALFQTVLNDHSLVPEQRLRRVIHDFFKSECDEAQIRVGLGDAAPLYRDAPEAKELHRSAMDAVAAFMIEAMPGTPEHVRQMAAHVIMIAMAAIGKRTSEDASGNDEIEACAAATADMAWAYLEWLARTRGI